jgi:drug/metabolite transporter (DMT)-like permease
MRRYVQVYTLLLIAIVLTVTGEILLKLGMNHVSADVGAFTPTLPVLWATFTQWRIILGFAMIFGGSIFWLAVISRADFSFAYPLLSLSYVIALIPAYFVLHEQIAIQRIVGALIVVIGALVIGWERPKPETETLQ